MGGPLARRAGVQNHLPGPRPRPYPHHRPVRDAGRRGPCDGVDIPPVRLRARLQVGVSSRLPRLRYGVYLSGPAASLRLVAWSAVAAKTPTRRPWLCSLGLTCVCGRQRMELTILETTSRYFSPDLNHGLDTCKGRRLSERARREAGRQGARQKGRKEQIKREEGGRSATRHVRAPALVLSSKTPIPAKAQGGLASYLSGNISI